MGVAPRPSLHLKASQTGLSLRLLACHGVDTCRHDLGPPSPKKTPALSHRACVDGVQGRVHVHRDIIAVRVYGVAHAAAAAAVLTHLAANLESAGVAPCIPWLGNRRLRFTFH